MNRISALLCAVAAVVLASCASSTMDSIPTGAQMQIYKDQAQREFGSEYLRLAELRHSKVLNEAEYQEELLKVDERVVARAHTLAWEQHNLAELERKAQGVPTPPTTPNRRASHDQHPPPFRAGCRRPADGLRQRVVRRPAQ